MPSLPSLKAQGHVIVEIMNISQPHFSHLSSNSLSPKMIRRIFPEILKTMFEKSPIFHADKIVAPIFLMIGKNDLRVPPSQGRELYHHLKSQGKEVYMNIYEDCHPLAKLPVHSDVLVNAALFFESVLNVGSQ